MKNYLKKSSALLLSFIFTLIISSAFLKEAAYALTNTNEVTAKCPYDGTLKEKNYKGLQTIDLTTNSGKYYAADTMYNQIYNGLLNYSTSIDVSSYSPSTTDQVFRVFLTVINDHPDLFYIDFSNSSVGYYKNTSLSNYCKLEPSYLYSQSECQSKRTQLLAKVNTIISSVTSSSMTSLEKELAIHDYVVNNVTYNMGTETWLDHSAWGPLIDGTGVCDGYSKSLKLLLNKVGIPCIVVDSDSMGHAWNIVNINGKYYHVDSTWDDPVPEENRAGYYYFNVSDSVISDSNHKHTWVNSDYPACTDSTYSYLQNDNYSELMCTRNNDIFYYFDASHWTLHSISIYGTNNVSLNTKIFGDNPYIFGNYIYYLNGYDNFNVYKINIKNINGTPIKVASNNSSKDGDDLYIKNGYLNLNYVDYSSSTSTTSTPILTGVNVCSKEDFNRDGFVNINDLAHVAKYYNKSAYAAGVDSAVDVKKDGFIDIYDLVVVSKNMEN